jgi:drug/metabolite transporter (DMT)-like permease
MADLLLSVLSSALIFVAFKLFRQYKIYTLYGIVVNYATAASLGMLFYFGSPGNHWPGGQAWMLGCLILGILFILVFNLMARTAQEIGVGIASVATKMSLVVPVLFGLLFLNERTDLFQLIGIVLALVAVYLITAQKGGDKALSRSVLWLPVLVFLGSGIIDTSINFLREQYLNDALFPLFSSLVFAVAAGGGLVFFALNRSSLPALKMRDILGGIGLGIPNYFSIYFLLRALNQESWGSAMVFTLNNVAIVLLSTLIGIFLFKERLRILQGLGIAIALVSIVMLAL